MTPQTQTSFLPGDPASAAAPGWLYDTLMMEIEPDLVSDEVPHLSEKYKDETPEEHELRMESYDHAFLAFDDALATTQYLLSKDAMEWKKEMRSKARTEEQQSRSVETKTAEGLFDEPRPS